MNILFKHLLLKAVVLVTCANTYSSDSSITSYSIANSSDSINNNKDNIYHPNILNFIRNKNKERTEIINGQ